MIDDDLIFKQAVLARQWGWPQMPVGNVFLVLWYILFFACLIGLCVVLEGV